MSTIPSPVHEFIYLASQSPRRAQLLNQLRVAHRPLLPGPDEDTEALEWVRDGESPQDYVQRVTLAKLAAAQSRLHARDGADSPILCADTTVALGAQILGKPRDDAHAVAMLQSLSGRTHQVLTAVAMAAGRVVALRLSVSEVTFGVMMAEEIDAYVATGEPRGKAGSYAIQSEAAAWIPRMTGSYSGVMGLPLFETAELLRQFHVRWG